MSWQAYVDNLLATGQVEKAALGGFDGSVWAYSAGFNVQPDELKAIAGGFDDGGANLRGSGLKLSGEKFMFLRADDEMMAGKKGPGGVTIYKTAQAIIIGTYNENMAAGTNSIQVGKIADYLKESGY